MSSPVSLSIACLSSVVSNVRTRYSGGWNCRQCFYAIWYLGHLWPFGKNFNENRPWETPPPGELNKDGWPNIAIMDLSNAISRKRCKIGAKLVLITNTKLHVSFRLVPNSMTLDDFERRNSPNRSVISPNSVAFGTDCVKVVEDTTILSATEM